MLCLHFNWKVIVPAAISLPLLFCLCFIFHEEIIRAGIAIRHCLDRRGFTEQEFDSFFTSSGEVLFKRKIQFTGARRDDCFCAQFKMDRKDFESALSAFRIAAIDQKDAERQIDDLVRRSGLHDDTRFEKEYFCSSSVTIYDHSMIFVPGIIFGCASPAGDFMLVTLGFVKVFAGNKTGIAKPE